MNEYSQVIKVGRPGQGALGVVKNAWDPRSPRRAWPRRLRANLSAAALGMSGQSLIGMEGRDNRVMVSGQIGLVSAGAVTNQSDNGVAYTRLRRSGDSAGQEVRHWGLQSIHGYLDPAGPDLRRALVCQDLVKTVTASGSAWYAFGWFNMNTAADTTSFVGVAWVGDPATGNWMATVKDGTATPSNGVFSVDSGVAITTTRRLGIALNGADHTAKFYMNGTLMATYAPTSLPDQFGASGVLFGYIVVAGAGGDGQFYIHGGSNPRVLSIVEV